MKKLLLLIALFTLGLTTTYAQDTDKKEKKVVIVKKKIDENGKEVVEKTEASGAEADELIKKMEEELDMDLEGTDIDIEIEDGDKKVIKKVKKESMVIEKSSTSGEKEEKQIRIKIDSDDDVDVDQMIEEMMGDMDEKDGHIKVMVKKDGDKTMKKVHKDHMIIKKSKTSSAKGEKTVTVDVEGDGDEQEYTIKIKGDDGEEKVMKWKGDGEMPAEMMEHLGEEGMIKIDVDEEGDGEEKVFVVKVEAEDEDIPETKVRMGVQLLDNGNQVTIEDVVENSPAAVAGLQSGDIITEINENYVPSYKGLMEQLAERSPGDVIKVRYIRNGKAATTNLTLAMK